MHFMTFIVIIVVKITAIVIRKTVPVIAIPIGKAIIQAGLNESRRGVGAQPSCTPTPP